MTFGSNASPEKNQNVTNNATTGIPFRLRPFARISMFVGTQMGCREWSPYGRGRRGGQERVRDA